MTAAPITYDNEAMTRRTKAIMDFLDLNLDEWEAWLDGDGPDRLPNELHTPVVQVISSLRIQSKGDATEAMVLDARGDYMQALAQLPSDLLETFCKEVRPA